VIKSLAAEYPSARELGQLEFEYRILRRLASPGIIEAIELIVEGDRAALVLADIGGEDLASLLTSMPQASAGLPIELFLPIAISVAGALAHVHAHNVIHRDIKPQNIIFSPQTREVRLIDFSISSELSLFHQGPALANDLEGSLPYMSPEQTGRMNRDMDYRTDYYSLGVTFFELLTGGLPFTATEPLAWIHGHVSKIAPSVRDKRPEIPETLALIVAKLMAKNPDDRYQSARGLLKDLNRCQREWTTSGTIRDFELARHDVSERFRLSRTLIGRETESSALHNAFEDVSRGPSRLLLVTGSSGVGKSSLISELHRAVARHGGRFISGKFDQLGREAPYAAVGQALRALVKELLTESDDRLRLWRESLVSSLGPNTRILVDLIPELEQVIGPQPSIVALTAEETQNSFRRIIRNFLNTLASPAHPLVIFLDDLQWADAALPQLLGYLLADEAFRSVLFIGAYREQDVPRSHPLLSALEELEAKRAGAVQRIHLAPLSLDGVNQIVAATLNCGQADSRPLSERVFQKTAGNPFFVNELLSLFHREGAFRFAPEEGRWEWDDEKIEGAATTDSVVDIVVQRLKTLPALAVECLSLAACIGNRFTLDTLAKLAERPAGMVAAALRKAIDDCVLVPLDGSYRLIQDGADYDAEQLKNLAVGYRFQHDRVQEAAYSQLATADRARVHLSLGRILLAELGPAEADKDIFEVVNNLNLGRHLIETASEREHLGRLNESAARLAKRAVANSIAAGYLEVRLELASQEEQSLHPGRVFECRRMHVESVYLAGEVERAGLLCDALVTGAPDSLSAAAALTLKALILSHQGRLFDAVDTIRAGLGRLGVALPGDPAEIDGKIGEGIAKMQAHLARTSIEDFVALPQLTDQSKIVTMNLLYHLVPSAIQTYPPLFVLAELMMFDLALTEGTTAVSCKNFVDCGMIQAGILGDFTTAYRLGKVAFALLERDAPSPLESAVNFVFASFVSHWRAPYREGLEAFSRAQRAGVEAGDVLHAMYAYALEVHRHLSVGTPLGACYSKSETAVAFLKQTQSIMEMMAVRIAQRAFNQLRGSGAGPQVMPPLEDEFTREVIAMRNPQWIFMNGQIQAMVGFILGEFGAAQAWTTFCEPYLPSSSTNFSMPDYHLFRGLLLAESARAAPAERTAILTSLIEERDRLQKWAESSPANFAHKHKLICAELARAQDGPIEEVIHLYGEALEAADEDFVHLRALINERQAGFWFDKRQPKIARTFLQEAYYLYGRWGCHRKLRQMERQYAEWLGRASDVDQPASQLVMSRDTVVADSLDLTSVVKVTHALSSEVRPDRLFATLMAAIVENAGAQRGCLILKAEAGDELTVVATAGGGDAPPESAGALPLEACAELCPRVVRYVARTGDPVVIDDACNHASYQDEPYVKGNGIKSVLCLPVLNQGKLLGILYAENNAVTHVFTPQRLTLLQLIASQAAISLTNARLYDSLEARVSSRTIELSRANEVLATEMKVRENMEFELRQAQKLEAVGRLASGIAHEINTPIQFVNDSVQFVRDSMTDLMPLIERYRAVTRAVLAGEGSSDLAEQVVAAEEQADLSYVLENVPLALTRSLEGIDRVATIVRSMKEFAHPDQKDKTTIDLNQAIASTLTIARNEYKYVADVETDFGELLPVTCHVGEVNQAVLNLIVNAAHAIGEVVKRTERKGLIHVSTRMDKGWVVIAIKDTGGGIPDQVRDRIFDPFFTTKAVGKGTGQGLFIARSVIAEKHGGTLTFTTQVGQGTTFFVRLPAEGAVSSDAA
jgi:predicted ATPase/signal transduction histidine kinase